MPVLEAVAALCEEADCVLVVGARPVGAAPSRVGRLAAPVDESEILAWFAARPGRNRALVLDSADALGSWLAAESQMARLSRFVEAMKGIPGLRLVLLEPVPPERVLLPNFHARALLAQVEPPRFWIEGQLRREGEIGALAVARARRGGMGFGLVTGLAMFLTALLMCAPALDIGAGTPLLGAESGSLPGSLWLDWWTLHALQQGQNPLWSSAIYWPVGADLIEIFGNVGAAFLALPFQLLLGFPHFWNAFVVTALASSGLATVWLARELGAPRTGALLAGLAFTAAPPLLQAVSQGDQAVFCAGVLPLAVGMGLRSLDRGAWSATLAGFSFAFAAFVWWFYGLFAVALVFGIGVHRAWRQPSRRRWLVGQLGRSFRAALPVTLLALPLIAKANRGEMTGLSWLSLPILETDTRLGTVEFLRIKEHSLSLLQLLPVPGTDPSFLVGALVVGLIGSWLLIHKGRRLVWVIVLVASAVLAAGPWMPPELGEASRWLPLPLALVEWAVPLVSRLHQPDRLLVVTALAASLLLSQTWDPCRRSLPASSRWLVTLLALVGIAATPTLLHRMPLPTTDYTPPEWARHLGAEGAVIHVPLGWSEVMPLFSPVHGAPITGGPGEAVAMADPTPYRALFDEDPSLAWFTTLSLAHPEQVDLEGLARRGARYVVVHRQAIDALVEGAGEWRVWALPLIADRIAERLGPPLMSVDGVEVYALPLTGEREVQL